MSIGFRTPDIEDLGLAGYLRIMPGPDSGTYDGVLFIVNGSGEPIEFCFSTIDMPRTILWGKAALLRRVAAELTKALISACASVPAILFALAREVGPDTFGQDVVISLPTCRIAARLDAVALGVADQEENVQEDEDIQLIWSGDAPAPDAPVRRLLARLATAGMLLEPFERAAAGLSEVRRNGVDS